MVTKQETKKLAAGAELLLQALSAEIAKLPGADRGIFAYMGDLVSTASTLVSQLGQKIENARSVVS